MAQELLGKHLVRRWRNVERSAVIHEVEAYVGPHDLACHGRFGRTARAEVMFGPPEFGTFTSVTEFIDANIARFGEDWPVAVLLRGAGEFTGPWKTHERMRIDVIGTANRPLNRLVVV